MKSIKEQYDEFEGKMKYMQHMVGLSDDEGQEMCRVALKWAELSPHDVSESISDICKALNGGLTLLDMSTHDVLRMLSLKWNTRKSNSNRNAIRANQRRNKFKSR